VVKNSVPAEGQGPCPSGGLWNKARPSFAWRKAGLRGRGLADRLAGAWPVPR